MLSTILQQKLHSSQRETLKDCTAPKPLEYLRVQGFANNEIRLTVRSKTLGTSYTHLLNETELIKDKSSRRHNRYKDKSQQRAKNQADKFRAILDWFIRVQYSPGWHSAPIPGFWNYLPATENYKGHRIKSEALKYLVQPDGKVSVWDTKSERFVSHFDIATVRAKIEGLLVITNELQVTRLNSAELGQDNRNTNFTRRARHKILEAGQVVENLCPTADPEIAAVNARAITLTLPGSTPEAIRALAAWSSWLVNNLMQEVRDIKKLIHYFWVWEHQKRGALHYHLCIAAHPDDYSMDELGELGDRMISRWWELLKVMESKRPVARGGKKGNLPGIDMFERSDKAVQARGGPKTWRDQPEKWRADNQPIKKSVAGYFSKYASKNVSSGYSSNIQNAYSPSRWWGMSQSISDEIKKLRFDYTVPYNPTESNQLIEDILDVWKVAMQYSYTFRITSKHETAESESSINVVNGITKVLYWDKSIFHEVWGIFQDLKSTFSETGYLRETRDIQVSDFDYYKFYSNASPCSQFPTVEPLTNKRIKFNNTPLSNGMYTYLLTPVDTCVNLIV